MRAFLIATAVWTIAAAGIVLLWPGSVPSGGCWRLVEPPPGCLDQLAELNRQVWWSQTAPMLALIVGGYLLIAVVSILAVRRRRE